jgi:hypothetical protein
MLSRHPRFFALSLDLSATVGVKSMADPGVTCGISNPSKNLLIPTITAGHFAYINKGCVARY